MVQGYIGMFVCTRHLEHSGSIEDFVESSSLRRSFLLISFLLCHNSLISAGPLAINLSDYIRLMQYGQP